MAEGTPTDYEKALPPGTLVEASREVKDVVLKSQIRTLRGGAVVYGVRYIFSRTGDPKAREWVAFVGPNEDALLNSFDFNAAFNAPDTYPHLVKLHPRFLKKRGS